MSFALLSSACWYSHISIMWVTFPWIELFLWGFYAYAKTELTSVGVLVNAMMDEQNAPFFGCRSRKYCCIRSNYRGKTVNGWVISLHRFPIYEERRREWPQCARLIRKNFTYTKNSYLCSLHFVNGDGPAAEHPLPSIFTNKVF